MTHGPAPVLGPVFGNRCCRTHFRKMIWIRTPEPTVATFSKTVENGAAVNLTINCVQFEAKLHITIQWLELGCGPHNLSSVGHLGCSQRAVRDFTQCLSVRWLNKNKTTRPYIKKKQKTKLKYFKCQYHTDTALCCGGLFLKHATIIDSFVITICPQHFGQRGSETLSVTN